mgnify:CR=1 FL=1
MKNISLALSLLLLGGCANVVDATNAAGTLVATPTESTAVAKRFPNVDLTDLATGTKLKFDEIKKPVAITFWATWCATCKQEMPLWSDPQLASKMIGINVQDASASESLRVTANNLMKTNETSFPSYVDVNDELTSKLGIIGLPVTIVVDSAGNITKRKDGLLSQQELLSFIKNN